MMLRTTTTPYYKTDPGQNLAETMGLPDATVGIYSKVKDLYWIGNCSLPERADLECRLGIKTKRQREMLDDVLRRFFPEGKHPRLDLNYFEVQEASQKQRERANKRWNKADTKKAESTLADDDF